MTSAHAEVPHRRQLVLNPGNRKLDVDRIVALPELFGPSLPGLPHDEFGFLVVDEFGQVPGAGPVFAAGDVTSYPIKHGGIATQMADGAAQSIAALAGAELEPEPLDPVLRGVLLTGHKPRYLSGHRVGGHAFDSAFSETPLWDPPTKISSRYVAPFLAQQEHAATKG